MGTRPDGKCDYSGVQLIPGSLTGGSCTNATLSVRNGKLVGLDADGDVVCKGEGLANASFTVRSWKKLVDGQPARREIKVDIAEVKRGYRADNESGLRMVYRMSFQGASLCTKAGANSARVALFGEDATTYGADPLVDKQYVLPVVSEIYDKYGMPFAQSDDQDDDGENEWLQLACVDDALAKRSLYNLHTDDLRTSRSALQMLVANYCGHLHATTRGTDIQWSLANSDDAPSTLDVNEKLEARWGPTGAVCVEKPRAVYRKGASNPQPPTDLTGDLALICAGGKCSTWQDSVTAIRSCQPPPTPGAETAAVPACSACRDCKGRLLRSFVVKQTKATPPGTAPTNQRPR